MKEILEAILEQIAEADITPIRNFLFENPGEPLVATGSGGAEAAADLLALLYGARGGVGTAVSPMTLNSFSDSALSTSKILLISKGGHNKDIIFATRRGLKANPEKTAGIFLYEGERNESRKILLKAKSKNSFCIPLTQSGDGFVAIGTTFAYFALFARIFQPKVNILKYKNISRNPYTICLNDDTPLKIEDLKKVNSYLILHGSWGRPVADSLEGKLVESSLATASVFDFRNYCHGRFIYTSNHLDDSAIVMLISPREKKIAQNIRKFLPKTAKLILIETEKDAPEASLDQLIRSTKFFHDACDLKGVNPKSPANPGKIDKRRPISIPFTEELKKYGPLTL